MSFSTEFLDSAHRHCSTNRQELLNSSKCGCFYCFKIYESSEIENWVEETQGNFASASDPFTALCPKCGIDAVIGTASGYPVDDVTFLQNMHTKWFE